MKKLISIVCVSLLALTFVLPCFAAEYASPAENKITASASVLTVNGVEDTAWDIGLQVTAYENLPVASKQLNRAICEAVKADATDNFNTTAVLKKLTDNDAAAVANLKTAIAAYITNVNTANKTSFSDNEKKLKLVYVNGEISEVTVNAATADKLATTENSYVSVTFDFAVTKSGDTLTSYPVVLHKSGEEWKLVPASNVKVDAANNKVTVDFDSFCPVVFLRVETSAKAVPTFNFGVELIIAAVLILLAVILTIILYGSASNYRKQMVKAGKVKKAPAKKVKKAKKAKKDEVASEENVAALTEGTEEQVAVEEAAEPEKKGKKKTKKAKKEKPVKVKKEKKAKKVKKDKKAKKEEPVVTEETAEAAVEGLTEEAVEEKPVSKKDKKAKKEKPVKVKKEKPVKVKKEKPVKVKKEKPVKVKKEKPVKVKEEKPAKVAAVAAVAAEVPVSEPATPTFVHYSRSFKARLCQAGDEVQNLYNEVKCKLLSYNGAASTMTWKYESFTAEGKEFARLNVRDGAVVLYFAVKAGDVKHNAYVASTQLSQNADYANLPVYVMVSGVEGLAVVDALLADTAKVNKLTAAEVANTGDYRLPYETLQTLIERGLIKPIV